MSIEYEKRRVLAKRMKKEKYMEEDGSYRDLAWECKYIKMHRYPDSGSGETEEE